MPFFSKKGTAGGTHPPRIPDKPQFYISAEYYFIFTVSSYNISAQKSRDSGKIAGKYVKIPFTKAFYCAIIDTNKNEKRKEL